MRYWARIDADGFVTALLNTQAIVHRVAALRRDELSAVSDEAERMAAVRRMLDEEVAGAIEVDEATYRSLVGRARRHRWDGAAFVPYVPPPETPEERTAREAAEADARLKRAERDVFSADVEMLITTLVSKGVIDTAELPASVRDRLAARAADRAKVADSKRGVR